MKTILFTGGMGAVLTALGVTQSTSGSTDAFSKSDLTTTTSLPWGSEALLYCTHGKLCTDTFYPDHIPIGRNK